MPLSGFFENDQLKSIGSIFQRENKAYIFNVATEKTEQGRGLGKQLMLEMLQYGINQGVVDFYLDSSPEGLPLYHRLGFQIQDFRFPLVLPPQ